MRKTVRIPVSLYQLVIQRKCYNSFLVWLACRQHTVGRFILSSELLSFVESMAGLKARAIRNHLKRLVEYKWLGYNKGSKEYFVRGVRRIVSEEKLDNWRVAEFEYAVLYTHIRTCATTAVVAMLIHVGVRKRLGSALLKHNALRRSQLLSEPHPVAVRALSKILHCSTDTISKYLNMAVRMGLLNKKKNEVVIMTGHKQIRQYLLLYGDRFPAIFIRGSELIERKADRYRANVRLLRPSGNQIKWSPGYRPH